MAAAMAAASLVLARQGELRSPEVAEPRLALSCLGEAVSKGHCGCAWPGDGAMRHCAPRKLLSCASGAWLDSTGTACGRSGPA